MLRGNLAIWPLNNRKRVFIVTGGLRVSLRTDTHRLHFRLEILQVSIQTLDQVRFFVSASGQQL